MPLSTQRISHAAWLAFAAFLVTSNRAVAVEFLPRVSIAEIHTDNVALTSPEYAQSELVTQLMPGFLLSQDAPRLKGDLDYQVEALHYRDLSDQDGSFQQLNGNLDLTVAEEFLFLAADASRSQANVNPEFRLSSSNIPINTNRTEVDSLDLRPYIDRQFGSAFRLYASYSEGTERYGQESLQDVDVTRKTVQFSGPNIQRVVNWRVSYNSEALKYEVSPTVELRNAVFRLGFDVSARMNFYVEGGRENNYRVAGETQLDENRWETGVSWEGVRSSVELGLGEQSIGNIARFQYEREYRASTFQILYVKRPSAVELLNRQAGIYNSSIGVLGGAQRFIQTQANISYSIERQRTTLRFLAYVDDRSERLNADDQNLGDQREDGVTLEWSRRFGNKTSVSLMADARQREFYNSGVPSKINRLSLGVGRELGSRTDLDMRLSYEEQAGETNYSAEYKEFQVRVTLSRRFLTR